MDVTIPKSLEALVRRKVDERHYSTEDEVVADALRLMQARDEVAQITRARLQDAIERGYDDVAAGKVIRVESDDQIDASSPTCEASRIRRDRSSGSEQLWYQKHFGAPVSPPRPGAPIEAPRTEANCKVPRGPDRTWPALEGEGTYRTPTAGVTFGDVAMNWYMRQGEKPLAGTRGQMMDHVALSVLNLDAWVAKLGGEGVKILRNAYQLGDTRAVLVEGPSREAIELVEVR